MAGAQEPARSRELHFLRRLESSICCAAFFYHEHGFLARRPHRKSYNSEIKASVARSQRVHEPEHAWVF